MKRQQEKNARVQSPPPKPLLIYNADCEFCRLWIRRWQERTGDRVDYRPFEDKTVPAAFPEISPDALAEAVHYIATDGMISSGAEAALRALAQAPRRKHWLWIYLNIPGAPWLYEAAYRLVARHRDRLFKLTRFLL